MNKLLQMSIAVDLFMLQLIETDQEKTTDLKLPKALLDLYREICELVGAKAEFLLNRQENDSFHLMFADSDEQDKVWSHLYKFSHSGKRTFDPPNVYDQTDGQLNLTELNRFITCAIEELKHPSDQFLLVFHLNEILVELDPDLVNKKFKEIFGHGIKYVMLWNSEKNLPSSVMVEGVKDLTTAEEILIRSIYEMAHKAMGNEHTEFDEFYEYTHPISISIYSKFGFEDIELWSKFSERLALV